MAIVDSRAVCGAFIEIHIDHIKPQAMFDLADDAQWRQCWSLANLQPLWAKENIMKGAKFIVKDYGSLPGTPYSG